MSYLQNAQKLAVQAWKTLAKIQKGLECLSRNNIGIGLSSGRHRTNHTGVSSS